VGGVSGASGPFVVPESATEIVPCAARRNMKLGSELVPSSGTGMDNEVLFDRLHVGSISLAGAVRHWKAGGQRLWCPNDGLLGRCERHNEWVGVRRVHRARQHLVGRCGEHRRRGGSAHSVYYTTTLTSVCPQRHA